MKKLFMVASMALAIVSLNSCGSDDGGNGGVSSAKLIGKWEHDTEKVTAAGQVLQPEQAYSENEPGCSKDYIQFAENGTFTLGDYWSSDCDLDTTAASWTIDGKDVTVSGTNVDTETFTVVSVSATKLKVKYVEAINGVNFTEEYTFTKAAQ
ncbi:lipocalin family protein [Flavobacterium sp.]|uniref:lipocalin family protein n=1 Tax=Flavobacterium sp. TaxID=239 RepID=UPI0011F918DC|nr:lipocalin family protein [Flavobacterium sp.]RZJ69539.1 MAG: hypothetical protein EOO49_17100 [Flavobacterium sp.]